MEETTFSMEVFSKELYQTNFVTQYNLVLTYSYIVIYAKYIFLYMHTILIVAEISFLMLLIKSI